MKPYNSHLVIGPEPSKVLFSTTSISFHTSATEPMELFYTKDYNTSSQEFLMALAGIPQAFERNDRHVDASSR